MVDGRSSTAAYFYEVDAYDNSTRRRSMFEIEKKYRKNGVIVVDAAATALYLRKEVGCGVLS